MLSLPLQLGFHDFCRKNLYSAGPNRFAYTSATKKKFNDDGDRKPMETTNRRSRDFETDVAEDRTSLSTTSETESTRFWEGQGVHREARKRYADLVSIL